VAGVLLLLAVPLAICGAVVVGLVRNQYINIYGRHFAGEPTGQLDYVLADGGIIFDYNTGWSGVPPAQGEVLSAPGLTINRTVVTLTGQTRGDVIIDVRLRYGLLATVSLPPIVLAYFLVRPLWRRRRLGPGHCRKCGYDLRATTDRCPECGSAVDAVTSH